MVESAIVTRPTECRSPLLAPICLIGDFGFAHVRRFLDDPAQPAADAERLRTLYEAWGFPDIRAEARVVSVRGGVRVEFHIDEGEPIAVRSVVVRGLEAYSPPIQLPKPLPLATGGPYALPLLDATQRVIRELLAERGQPYAQIEVSGDVDEATRTAAIVLHVVPGPLAYFGPIAVTAEPPIDRRAVVTRLAYAPGDLFRPSRILRSERLLYGLPVVERAAIAADALQRGDTMIPTVVIVDARRVHGVQAGGTLSSTQCLALGGQWQHRHFLGWPRVLTLGVALSNLFAAQTDGGFPCSGTGTGDFGQLDYDLQAELWQPSMLGDHRNVLTAAAFARRQSAPNIFIQRGYGGRIAFARDLGGGLTARLGYSAERNELDASGIYFCSNYGVCTAEGIATLSSPRRFTPLELIGLFSTVETAAELRRPPQQRMGAAALTAPFAPWRATARLALDGAAGVTGSEQHFARAVLEATATRILGRTGELAGRVRLGAVASEDIALPQVRLYSGGVNTVRGVGQNLLGPKVLVAASADPPTEICPPDDVVCDDVAPVDPDDVRLRPTGGNRLLEANLEARIWLTENAQVAWFVDAGWLSRVGAGLGAAALGPRSERRITPGLGIRVLTAMGPLRIDLGYDPAGPQVYPLLADDGEGGVTHAGNASYDPYRFDSPGSLREHVRRIRFHFSIGGEF